MLLHAPNLHLLPVKHPRRQRRLHPRPLEHIHEVLLAPGTAARDHRYRHRPRHGIHQRVIESVTLSVHVNAVQHNLSGPQGFGRLGDGHGANILGLASSFDGALIPAVLFSIRTLLTILQRNHCVLFVHAVGGGHVHSLGIDRNHHCLHAVNLRNSFDARLPRLFHAQLVILFGGDHRVRSDADLIGPRPKVSTRHLQRRVNLLALGIRVASNPAADGQRDEDALARLLEDLEHGHVLDNALSKGRYVQESNLVGALGVVSGGELYWLA
mmetsp:Transcript_5555/g.9270  ORF Transcript_5555/g.9270 Transcript_5555/m.9270 type:complete len:269 (-) Transcript_5555:587-1393(-)